MKMMAIVTVTVTVTEALVLRPLLEDRGRITVNPYPGARRQNETEMFSDHDETSPSIAAVSALSVACSMLSLVHNAQNLHFIIIIAQIFIIIFSYFKRSGNVVIHTLFAVIRKATPSGINPTPIANSSGNTVLAVNIGCQAGNCCCLNFVSTAQHKYRGINQTEDNYYF